MLDGCVPWPDDVAARYRREGYWQGTPLGDLLLEACARHADKVAVVCDEERLTYAELGEESTRVAARLLELGLGPLDRVVVHLPNVPRFAVVVLALFRIGAIPVMALPGHRKVEITHLCRQSGAVAYVVLDSFRGFDFRSLAREVCADVSSLRQVLVAGEVQEFTPLDAPAPREVSFPRVDPSEPALFLLSGGTTGLPKLIPRTHDDYAYNMRAAAEALRFGTEDTYLAVNPVAHNSALGCPGLLGALLAGGKVVLTSSVRPADLFALIQRENVTLTTLVPAVVRLWMDAAAKEPVDLSGLLLQIGSSKFDPARAGRVREVLGCRLSQWFGIGEGLLTYTRLDDPDEVVVNTEGRPLAEADEILVCDANGHPVPDGEVGELLARGPYTIRGYYRAEEQNARAFSPDGFFRTGDLVRRTPDGNIVVVGRIKDVINRAGEKVPAEEVEDHLLRHPSVRDAAVVGVDDSVLGEKIVAFVILRDPDVKLSAVKTFLRERGLATFKIPDKVVSLTDLPRTAVGKIDKAELRASAS